MYIYISTTIIIDVRVRIKNVIIPYIICMQILFWGLPLPAPHTRLSALKTAVETNVRGHKFRTGRVGQVDHMEKFGDGIV